MNSLEIWWPGASLLEILVFYGNPLEISLSHCEFHAVHLFEDWTGGCTRVVKIPVPMSNKICSDVLALCLSQTTSEKPRAPLRENLLLS